MGRPLYSNSLEVGAADGTHSARRTGGRIIQGIRAIMEPVCAGKPGVSIAQAAVPPLKNKVPPHLQYAIYAERADEACQGEGDGRGRVPGGIGGEEARHVSKLQLT